MELERGNLGSMDWQTRIVTDPAILVGKPTVKGARISVEFVVRQKNRWVSFGSGSLPSE